MAMCAAAVAAGARIIRVGYEDSAYYAPGKIGRTNAELVGRMTAMVKSLGFETAQAEEARRIIGIT